MSKTFCLSGYILAIIIVSAFSSLSANYAMIYHRTAALVSIGAVILSLFGLFTMYRKTDVNQHHQAFFLALGGTFIYTLYKPLIIIYLILLVLFNRSNLIIEISRKLPLPDTRSEKALGTLFIATLFLVNDLCREYSVWHKPQWNLLPLIGIGLSLIWIFSEWKRIRD